MEFTRVEPPPPGTLSERFGVRVVPNGSSSAVLLRRGSRAAAAPTSIDHLGPRLVEAVSDRRVLLLLCQQGALPDKTYSTLAAIDDVVSQRAHAGPECDVHVGLQLVGNPFVAMRADLLQVFRKEAYRLSRRLESGLATSVQGLEITPEVPRAFSARILAPTLEEGTRVANLLERNLPLGAPREGAPAQFAACVRVLPSLGRSYVSLAAEISARECYDHFYHLYANESFRAVLAAAERSHTQSGRGDR